MDKKPAMALAWIGRLFRPSVLRRRLCCSFCGRRADAVARLVAGANAYICDDCVSKCVAVLEQRDGVAPTAPVH